MLYLYQKFILKKDSLLLSDEIRKEIFLLPVPPPPPHPPPNSTPVSTTSSAATTSTSSISSLESHHEKEQQKNVQKQPRLSPLATNSLSASSLLKKIDSIFPIESEIYPEAHLMQKQVNMHQKKFKEPYDYNIIIDYQTESISSIEDRRLLELQCERDEQELDKIDRDSGRVVPIIVETVIKNDLRSFKAFSKNVSFNSIPKLTSSPMPVPISTIVSKKYIDDDDDEDRMLTLDEYERQNKLKNDKREEKRRREKKEKKEKRKEEKRKKRDGKLPPPHLAMTSLSPMPITFGSNLPSLNSISSLSHSDLTSNSLSTISYSSSTIMTTETTTTTTNTFDKTSDEKEEEKQEQQQQNSQNLYEKHKNCSKNPLRCSCRRPLNAPSRQTFPPFQETIIVPRSVTTLSTSSSSSLSSTSSTLSGNKLSVSTSLKRNSFTDNIDFATSSAGGAIAVGTN